MPKFRKKPVVIEAVQWFPNTKHPGVQEDRTQLLTDYYSPAPGSAMRELPAYFVTTIHDPCKPDIFAATYEAA